MFGICIAALSKKKKSYCIGTSALINRLYVQKQKFGNFFDLLV